MVARNNDCSQRIGYRINLIESLMKFVISKRPWESLRVDILEHNGRQYPVLQDYFSEFIELLELNKCHHLLNTQFFIFFRLGIPNLVISDNGPQFSRKKINILLRNIIFII